MDYLNGHGIENPRVLGSIPRLATSIQNGSQRWGPFSFVPLYPPLHVRTALDAARCREAIARKEESARAASRHHERILSLLHCTFRTMPKAHYRIVAQYAFTSLNPKCCAIWLAVFSSTRGPSAPEGRVLGAAFASHNL